MGVSFVVGLCFVSLRSALGANQGQSGGRRSIVATALQPVSAGIALVMMRDILGSQDVFSAASRARPVARIAFARGPEGRAPARVGELNLITVVIVGSVFVVHGYVFRCGLCVSNSAHPIRSSPLQSSTLSRSLCNGVWGRGAVHFARLAYQALTEASSLNPY